MSTTDSDTPGSSADEPELDYSSAVAELDDILLELEDEALDVDVLAERVERASLLIRFCRTRITSARTQVEQIVADLEELGDDE
jgi:exodeoxyribonuclease VII small subunit